MAAIGASVAEGGISIRDDVVPVQRLLNARSGASARLKVDGVAGSRTIAAAADIADRLSGAAWWYANQACYPNSNPLDDLAADFRRNAKRFVGALREGGASVRVSATLRNQIRAHLMHYSWRVARNQIAPADVPDIDGCDIIWDHGDPARSRAAAVEMVRLFRIVFKPSLTANHIQGTAVDMTIERPAALTVKDGADKTVTITSAAELHRLGTSFGVHKLATDAPHWSGNGR
jgi:hypothetical protein